MDNKENKKKLFMSLVEKAKNGTLDSFRMTESTQYDEIYSKLENNNGPFGLVILGMTKDGKISVMLSDSMINQRECSLGGSEGLGTLAFDESELNSFLDKFYDMNNMEILNEFYKNPINAPDYFKNRNFEDYKNHEFQYPKLVALNAIDFLNSQKIGNIIVRGNTNFCFENGLNLVADMESDNITIDMNGEYMIYNLKNGQIEEQSESFENSECSQYASIFLQSVDSLPKVYEGIMSGSYKKEDFIPAKNDSLLQQKENKLASLEAEEKTISEAEDLINMQNERPDIGEE